MAAIVWLAILVNTAMAAPPITIATPGSGAGKVSSPKGIAVDQSNGDLYVADSGNVRIDKFDAEGNFLLAWGFGVSDGKSAELQTCGPQTAYPRCFEPGQGLTPPERSELQQNPGAGNIRPQAVSVDSASHDVYVTDEGKRRVTKFGPNGEFIYMAGKDVNTTPGSLTPNLCTATDLEAPGAACGAGKSGAGPGEYFSSPSSIVVDSFGRLWVLDGSRIDEFDASGNFLSQVALSGGAGAQGMARDLAGNFYTIRPGVNEVQVASFNGFAAGDTFRLANLPPPCSSPNTAPITFYGDLVQDQASIERALREACGGNDFSIFYASSEQKRISFISRLAVQNVPQLSCTKLTGAGSCSIATDHDGAPGTVEKLDPSGALLKTIYSGGPEALAIDSADDLYVADKRDYHFLRFNPAGEQTSVFGTGQIETNDKGEGPLGNALALDEAGEALYAANGLPQVEGAAVQRFALPNPGPLPENLRAEDVLPSTATLAATLNPEGHSTEYRFEYLTQHAYEEQGESFEGPATHGTEEKTLAGAEFEEEEVSAAIEGLSPETEYRFRILANNSEGQTEAQATFATRPAVSIDAQWTSELTARSATVRAKLDPLGVAGKWWLEYGTSPCSGGGCIQSTHLDLPASFGDLEVGVALSGLAPSTAYFYRFGAEDKRDGTIYLVHGKDQSFTTQPATLGFALADHRAWEMVSPADKFGASITPGHEGEGQIQAAADGNSVSYLSAGSIEALPQGSRAPERSSVLSRRGAGGSWSPEDLSTPNAGFETGSTGNGFEYKLFDSDLSQALVEPRSKVPLSPEASERTPYLRQNAAPPEYTPLVVGCPKDPEPCPAAVAAAANVPAGTEFGHLSDRAPLSAARVQGATSDLSHVALASQVPLSAGAANNSLYEWHGGALSPISIPPAGGTPVAAELGSLQVSAQGAVSEDGSRVFWSTPGGAQPPSALYLRLNATKAQSAMSEGKCIEAAKACTIRLDEEQPGAFGTGAVSPVFWGANPSGTVALFTDTQNLTPNANESGADLYRCAVVLQEGHSRCDLTDLTAHTENPGNSFEGAEVQGMAVGVSEDASSAYFVARGVLGGANAEGRSPAPGQPNLYLWREGQGIRFIATLASADEGDWGDWAGLAAELRNNFVPAAKKTAAASPSGRYLAFMSALPLSGYDNADAKTGEADQEVFLYDAEADGGKGRLVCPSCNPSGARPKGVEGSPVPGSAPLHDLQELWVSGQPLAAVLPEATKLENFGAPSLYRPRAVQDDGRLFFNAADSLVSGDSNGTWDVYEYEPTGVGTCGEASGDAGTARASGGCVSLISSGTAKGEAGFLDASKGGDDVFFFSPGRLSALDEDEVTDVYDARVNGIPAQLEPIAECLGEACQPPTSAPEAQTPASAAFRGPGNPPLGGKGRHCHKGKRKVRRGGKVRCVGSHHRERHRHHRRRGHRHHRRAAR